MAYLQIRVHIVKRGIGGRITGPLTVLTLIDLFSDGHKMIFEFEFTARRHFERRCAGRQAGPIRRLAVQHRDQQPRKTQTSFEQFPFLPDPSGSACRRAPLHQNPLSSAISD